MPSGHLPATAAEGQARTDMNHGQHKDGMPITDADIEEDEALTGGAHDPPPLAPRPGGVPVAARMARYTAF
jgi:hypothetical protein